MSKREEFLSRNVLNDSYILGGINKQAVRIDSRGKMVTLTKHTQWEEDLHHRSLVEVLDDVIDFNNAQTYKVWEEWQEIPQATVCVYMENAKKLNSDLYLFCIDDDTKVDTPIGKYIESVADVATVSKSGHGGHRYFGVRKDDAIWDGLNLLSGGESYINKTGLLADDGTKIDVFMDAKRFIYERQGFIIDKLTDKTEIVVDIIKQFAYKRTTENKYKRSGRIKRRESYSYSEIRDYDDLVEECDEIQLKMLNRLETLSSDIDQSKWYSQGRNIACIFQDNPDLGGEVFAWWSAKDYGEKFDISQPIRTWDNICAEEEEGYLSTFWQKELGFADNREDIYSDIPRNPLQGSKTEEALNAEYQVFLADTEEEANRAVTIRDKELTWVTEKPKAAKGGFGEEEDGKKRNTNYIKYGEEVFTVVGFFRRLLGDKYLQFNYRAAFSKDAERHLSNNMLARFQYEALNNEFWTRAFKNPLTWEEQQELERFANKADTQNGTASFWSNRFTWASYWDNAVMFGATKDYPKTGGKCLYIYEATRKGHKVYFVETDLTWKRYAAHIMNEYRIACVTLSGNEIIYNALMPSLYYQNGIRITLPADFQSAIKRWVNEVVKGNEVEADFPFKDDTIINGGFDFIVDLTAADIQPYRSPEAAAALAAFMYEGNREKAAVKHRNDLEAAGFKSGDRVTTKEFNAKGIDDSKRRRLKKCGLIISVSHGLYEVT